MSCGWCSSPLRGCCGRGNGASRWPRERNTEGVPCELGEYSPGTFTSFQMCAANPEGRAISRRILVEPSCGCTSGKTPSNQTGLPVLRRPEKIAHSFNRGRPSRFRGCSPPSPSPGVNDGVVMPLRLLSCFPARARIPPELSLFGCRGHEAQLGKLIQDFGQFTALLDVMALPFPFSSFSHPAERCRY